MKPKKDAPPPAPTQVRFEQGDKTWTDMRKRGREDLEYFASIILGYAEKIPMRMHAHRLLCRIAQSKTGKPEIDDRLVFKCLLPRDWGKTSLLTIAQTLQDLVIDPDSSTLICNEREQNAQDILSEIKHHITDNELFRALYPEIIPKSYQDTTWSQSRINVRRASGRKEPSVFVIGVGGTVTGMHPDRIRVDDMISREAAENARRGSWQIMQEANRWLHTLESLLSQRKIGGHRITIIGTRWYFNDCYDHVDEYWGQEEPVTEWTLTVPIEEGIPQTLVVRTQGELLSFTRSAIEEGRSSFPEKWSMETLARMQAGDPILFSCFPPNQDVVTHHGHVPIAEVRTGDLVRGEDGSWSPVTHCFSQDWGGLLHRIRPWGSAVAIRATGDHRLWASRGVWYRNAYVTPESQSRQVTGSGNAATITLPRPEWIEAETLRTGDVLWSPIARVERWPQDWPEELRSLEVWFLVGHWMGDGSMSTNKNHPDSHSISHVFDPKHGDLAEKIQGIVRGLGRNPGIDRDKTVLRLGYGHRELGAFLHSCRRQKNSHKLLPTWVEEIPLRCQRQLIEGYWAADGCVTETKKIAGSVCLPLLEQMQRMLARLGEVGYVARTGANHRLGCRLHDKHYDAQQMYALTRYTSAAPRSPKVWIDGDWLCRRIRQTETEDYRGRVHTLEAGGSYTLAGNVLAKNCNYLNRPTSAATATFREDWLKRYRWLDKDTVSFVNQAGEKHVIQVSQMDVVLIVDPGGFGKGHEDRARGAVWAVAHSSTGEYLWLDCWSERDTYETLLTQIMAMIIRYHPRKVGVENSGQQVVFIDNLRWEVNRRQILCTVSDLGTNNKNKDDRILSLEPYFQRGLMYIGTGPLFAEFLTQYTQFPRSSRRDLLDAMAYLPKMLRPRSSQAAELGKERVNRELTTYYRRRGMTRFTVGR